MPATEPAARLRIDKWLWAARFFKARAVAAQAVEGGHVHVNGQRVKPAKDIKPGDVLDITVGDARWTVTVLALADRRGPATGARTLYAETQESQARRAAQSEMRKLAAGPAPGTRGRPSKKDRRQIRRFTGA